MAKVEEESTDEEAKAVRDQVREAYVDLFGTFPEAIERRLDLAERTGRLRAVEVVEAMRQQLIHENPLGLKTQQLVHFGQLLALGRREPAILHARAARRAGATTEELFGVAETALVTAGMPSYSLGVGVIADLIQQEA